MAPDFVDGRGGPYGKRGLKLRAEVLDGTSPSCILDIIDQHPDGMTHTEVGDILGLCRERIRQIENSAMRKVKRILTVQRG